MRYIQQPVLHEHRRVRAWALDRVKHVVRQTFQLRAIKNLQKAQPQLLFHQQQTKQGSSLAGHRGLDRVAFF